MSRRAYHLAYYTRTAARRRKLASDRRQLKRWSFWLLDQLLHHWPAERQPIYAEEMRRARLEYR